MTSKVSDLARGVGLGVVYFVLKKILFFCMLLNFIERDEYMFRKENEWSCLSNLGYHESLCAMGQECENKAVYQSNYLYLNTLGKVLLSDRRGYERIV